MQLYWIYTLMNPLSQYNNASDEIWIRVKKQVAGRERMQERGKTGVSDKSLVASLVQNISGSQTGGPGRILSGTLSDQLKKQNKTKNQVWGLKVSYVQQNGIYLLKKKKQ